MKKETKKKPMNPQICKAAQIFVQLTADQQEAILKIMREIVKKPG